MHSKHIAFNSQPILPLNAIIFKDATICTIGCYNRSMLTQFLADVNNPAWQMIRKQERLWVTERVSH